jgi:CHC2 zinc finger
MNPDHIDEPENMIADTIDAAEDILDPLEGLAEKTAADPGAAFMPEARRAARPRLEGRAVRANKIIPRKSMRKHGFDRNRLPPVADYYQPIFGDLRFNASGWAQMRCIFHEDGHASLSIHRERGAFRCFTCDTRGGDVLAFEMLRSGADFKSAARALGAWR